MNIRTSGVLSREDLQKLSVSQTHEGEGNGLPDVGPLDVDGVGAFADQHVPADIAMEGDNRLAASLQHTFSSQPPLFS